MEVNYFGVLRLVQAFAPVLAKNGGGAIANISSVVGLSSFPVLASYSASKAAVRSLTQAARRAPRRTGHPGIRGVSRPGRHRHGRRDSAGEGRVPPASPTQSWPGSMPEFSRSIPIPSPRSSVSSSRRARRVLSATSPAPPHSRRRSHEAPGTHALRGRRHLAGTSIQAAIGAPSSSAGRSRQLGKPRAISSSTVRLPDDRTSFDCTMRPSTLTRTE